MSSIFGKRGSSKEVEEEIPSQLLDLRQPKPSVHDELDRTPPSVSHQNLIPPQSSYGNAAVARTLIQRKPKGEEVSGVAAGASETTTARGEAKGAAAPTMTPTRALIVEDSVEAVEPGQMKKSEFLAQLRAAVCSTTADALAGSPLAVAATPYIDRTFAQYAAQDSAQLERSIRRYAPEAAGVTNAGGLIPIVTGRVRHSLTTWMTTGEMPEGLPLGLPGAGVAGAVGDAVSSVAEGAASVVSTIGTGIAAIGNLLFKGHDGGARADSNPEEIQSQVGVGKSLDGGVLSRMESAFGQSFGDVQVHADANGAGLSENLNARAFTVGHHIAFGAGEYQPGTLIGDALIAHELAHVMQQRGGTSGAGTAQKGTTGYGALEEDADEAAVGAVVSSRLGAKTGLAKIARKAMPSLKSGLRLQRCGGKKGGPPKEPRLLTDFAEKFADAAEMIRKSEPAMNLVREADAAGAKFGGYAEEGPYKNAWPYHYSGTVYIPKAHTDKAIAMSDFLFELNNAIRAPKFAELNKEAAKGSTGTLTAKDFAYKKVEQEVEGMLRLGEVWFETKKTLTSGTDWNKYDNDFYLAEYQSFKDGKKTKDDIVKEVLKRAYSQGKDAGKTIEQYYVEQYNEFSGGK